MTSITAYEKFVSRVNALDTSRGVNIDPRQFVFLFNEELIKWTEETQEQEDDNIQIQDIEELMVPYRSLTLKEERDDTDYITFSLPDDYFLRIDARIIGVKDECDSILKAEFIKPKQIETVLTSSFHKASFEMEHTVVFIAKNGFNVFKGTDFNISKVLFSYYHQPTPIDLAGYINENGISSTDVNSELSTSIMNKIIERAAKEFFIRNSDQVKAALSSKK